MGQQMIEVLARPTNIV